VQYLTVRYLLETWQKTKRILKRLTRARIACGLSPLRAPIAQCTPCKADKRLLEKDRESPPRVHPAFRSLQFLPHTLVVANNSGYGRWPQWPRLGDFGLGRTFNRRGDRPCRVSFSASATTPCAIWFASRLRLPRFFPFRQPPSLAFRREAAALAGDRILASSDPMLISFPQCGHFIAHKIQPLTPMTHGQNQSSPLPKIRVIPNGSTITIRSYLARR